MDHIEENSVEIKIEQNLTENLQQARIAAMDNNGGVKLENIDQLDSASKRIRLDEAETSTATSPDYTQMNYAEMSGSDYIPENVTMTDLYVQMQTMINQQYYLFNRLDQMDREMKDIRKEIRTISSTCRGMYMLEKNKNHHGSTSRTVINSAHPDMAAVPFQSYADLQIFNEKLNDPNDKSLCMAYLARLDSCGKQDVYTKYITKRLSAVLSKSLMQETLWQHLESTTVIRMIIGRAVDNFEDLKESTATMVVHNWVHNQRRLNEEISTKEAVLDPETNDSKEPEPNVALAKTNVEGEAADKVPSNVEKDTEIEGNSELTKETDETEQPSEECSKVTEDLDKIGDTVELEDEKPSENKEKPSENAEKHSETEKNEDKALKNEEKTSENEEKTSENKENPSKNEENPSETEESEEKASENEEKASKSEEKTSENTEKPSETELKASENEEKALEPLEEMETDDVSDKAAIKSTVDAPIDKESIPSEPPQKPTAAETDEKMEIDETPTTPSESNSNSEAAAITEIDLEKNDESTLVRISTPPLTGPAAIPDIGLVAQIEAAIAQASAKPQAETNGDKPPSNDVVDLLDDDEEDMEPERTEELSTEKQVNGNAKKISDVKLKHDCINPKCENESNDFMLAPTFIVNCFAGGSNSNRSGKRRYVCSPCYDLAVEKYQEYCSALQDQQPLLKMELPAKEEVVELLSDGEDDDEEDSEPSLESPENVIITKETLSLLEAELEGVIAETLEKCKISTQMKWTCQIIEARIDNNQNMLNENEADIRAAERKANDMYRKLYSINEVKYHALPTLEIVTSGDASYYKERFHLPPPGEVARPKINLSTMYYAVKQRLLSTWCQCKVIDVLEIEPGVHHFKVQFTDNRNSLVKVVPSKLIAYGHCPTQRLQVGERVIAFFNNAANGPIDTRIVLPKQFYPGIIAEPLQAYNNYRYLVFYDDGYAQYVAHQDVRLVYETSLNVWEDVHPHAKEFIQEYLKNYRKERPMVQARKGQRMVAEHKGRWQQAKVIDIDASLVRVYFQDSKRSEWIYRGSTRLAPLYKQKQMSKTIVGTQHQKRNEPSIEYITLQEDGEVPQAKGKQSTATETRAVARKSSAGGPPKPIPAEHMPAPNSNSAAAIAAGMAAAASQKIQYLNNSTIILDDETDKGRVVYYTARQSYQEKKFRPHDCNPNCLFKITHNLRLYSPIAKPLLSGWERQIAKQKTRRIVFYKAPCGRRLRSIQEVHRYLQITKCRLSIDSFDFDAQLHCLAEYVVDKEKAIVTIPDISEGKECVPVVCINYFDDTKPPPMVYSAVRVPTEGVNLNTDKEFLCGCDCEDDCLDKLKCACQQLTIAGTKFEHTDLPREQIGYQYKRLYQQVRTGIYECNANCKCSKKCLNRVVQHSLTNKVQLFKTNNRGWGLRTISDIPKGTFVCIYAGKLLTEEKANEGGAECGDEYYADLDYIEMAEQLKEGYESDAPEMSDESDYDPTEDKNQGSDDEFIAYGGGSTATRTTRVTRRTASRSVDELMKKATLNEKEKSKGSKTNSEADSDDEDSREKINLMPGGMIEDEMPQTKFRSLRKMYGKKESVYVMDAKLMGNIGRYFNHSCEPNMFVQNVFVDTHDLRFPWIAFFSSCYIKAGNELTWNYNYDVGSVPGKVLYCQCGSSKCRIRLL